MAKKYFATMPLTLTRAADIKDQPGVKPTLDTGAEFKLQDGYKAEDLERLASEGFLTTEAPAADQKVEDKPAV